jgi:hypothetical protein
MINIETACLLCILVSQWLQFWVLRRLYINLVELLASVRITKPFKPPPKDITYIPPEVPQDKDKGKIDVQRRP